MRLHIGARRAAAGWLAGICMGIVCATAHAAGAQEAPFAPEKKAAVRAFCSETSVPNTGASGDRAIANIVPRVSTSEIVTCARLSSGLRICARARLMIVNASSRTARTSACESGVGRRGLDYATLSRAFGYAGAPSVVASLWSVHDDATRLLMERFYGYRQQGLDVFESLARAQRDLIAKGGAWARPEAWSAFQAFGKP